MEKIGILTSGGDAPGMNAAIRAVVRAADINGIDVMGFRNGYDGLIDGDMTCLDKRAVGNIIQRGGSIIYSSRSARFREKENRLKAAEQMRKAGLEGLVVIGGEGSTKGATALAEDTGIPCVALPGTIDRDMPLVGPTIGFDTAVNTALNGIDNIRDTATTSDITHVVEVMGRNCGWLAVLAGIGGGAEAIVIPEIKPDLPELVARVTAQLKAGKKGCILIVAEGAYDDGGNALVRDIRALCDLDMRLTTLGHIQRGGSPTAVDRVLASQLGAAAVDALINGNHNVVLGRPEETVQAFEFDAINQGKTGMDKTLIELVNTLA